MGIIIDIRDVASSIHCDVDVMPNDITPILKKELNVKVPGAEYLYKFKTGEWDGTVDLYNQNAYHARARMRTHEVRTGVLPRIVDALSQYWPVQVGFDERSVPLAGVQLQPTNVPLRVYQRAAMEAAFSHRHPVLGWWPRGVLGIATGGGKTEIAVAMWQTNPVPTFFLVHRKDLLIQAKERFEKYGYRPGMLGAGYWSPDKLLNIAMLQTVAATVESDPSSYKFQQLEHLIGNCQQIFVDECHLAASSVEKGNEFVKAIDLFDRASFRWGLSATPFQRNAYDNMLLEGVTGTSLYTLSTDQLVKMGFLTKPKVIVKKVSGQMTHKMDWRQAKSNKARATFWRLIEERGIKFNEIRTKIMIEEIVKGPFPCLVLVKTVDQAMFINQMCQHITGRTIPFLSGSNSAAERKAGIEGLSNGSIPVLMATTIFDEGVDVPALEKVILASGGKSQVKMIQRVGRALRLSPGKQEAVIVDFADGHHSMLVKHATERRKVWEEQGFEVIDD